MSNSKALSLFDYLLFFPFFFYTFSTIFNCKRFFSYKMFWTFNRNGCVKSSTKKKWKTWSKKGEKKLYNHKILFIVPFRHDGFLRCYEHRNICDPIFNGVIMPYFVHDSFFSPYGFLFSAFLDKYKIWLGKYHRFYR